MYWYLPLQHSHTLCAIHFSLYLCAHQWEINYGDLDAININAITTRKRLYFNAITTRRRLHLDEIATTLGHHESSASSRLQRFRGKLMTGTSHNPILLTLVLCTYVQMQKLPSLGYQSFEASNTRCVTKHIEYSIYNAVSEDFHIWKES